MLKNCDNCKYDLFRLCGEEDKTPCDDCYNGNPPTKWEPGENYEPMTNADRIRAMTDEELAKVIAVIVEGDVCLSPRAFCGSCPFDDVCTNCTAGRELEWLHAPAEGE